MTDLGILVNHAYSLIDVAEVGEHQEKTLLLQAAQPVGHEGVGGAVVGQRASGRPPRGGRRCRRST